jgi:hypothetical protein
VEGLTKYALEGEDYDFTDWSWRCSEYAPIECYKNKKTLMVAKSLGAVKLHQALTESSYTVKSALANGNKISIILVDPHLWIWRKTLKYYDWMDHPNFNITAVYQRDRYPKGRRFKNDKLNVLVNNTNHGDIANKNTEAGRITAGIVTRRFMGLKGVVTNDN